MSKIYAGIDPGSSSSPTALAIIEEDEPALDGTKSLKIIGTYAIYPCHFVSKYVNRRIIATTLAEVLKEYQGARINIENPMLQGMARELLYALMALIENFIKVDKKIAPCSVKKFMGSGKLEKDQMAQNLLALPFDKKSKNHIKNLLDQKRFDETDALCIALFHSNEPEPEETE